MTRRLSFPGALALVFLLHSAFAATAAADRWQCGDTTLDVEHRAGSLWLRLQGRVYMLSQQPAASGTRFETIGDGPRVEFWSKGREATLTVEGTVYPACVLVQTAPPESSRRPWVVPAPQDWTGEWTVASIGDVTLPDSIVVTLGIQGRGVSGQAPCNSYRGNIELQGSALKVGPLMTTMKACSGPPPAPPFGGAPSRRPDPLLPPVMELERDFLAILGGAESYELRADGTLVLTAGDKRTIVARRK